MRCSSCHADNPTENRFCEQCGARLESCCPQCGTPMREGVRFCGHCGAALTTPLPVPPSSTPGTYTPKHLADKILTARSALEGERRQVTVLFADMAGFTTLAEQRDPEEIHQIVNRCFDLMTAEVHRFEGTINQYTGDGIMALFGAPIAHEDGPRRAVHAALAIQRALRAYSSELQDRHGATVQMRIGLHTGLVVVGKIGDDLRMDYTAVGDTTNLAARLQQVAAPGTVLISAVTHKLVAGFFETVDRGALQVKGHAVPVHAFEVVCARGSRARLDVAVEHGLTPLIGRDRELEALAELFKDVKAGRGQVVFIAGDAGIGKSRLVYELRRRLAAAGEQATWLEGRCVSFGQVIPLLPVVDQLRANFGIEEQDGEPEIIAKVEEGMRRLGDLDVHIPYIRYVLSVDPGDPGVAAMEASARRKRTFDGLRALGLRGAARQPLVFVYEDLHWIDTSTGEYVASIIDSVAGVPIMVIATYRVGYTPPFGSRSYFTTVNLHSLSETEAIAMAGRVLGTDDFPAELKTALMDKAEGVPLFVEEVTKTLLDLGVLRREGAGYRMVKQINQADIPDTIQGIIMARLDRLGEDGKRTVQLASVIGRQFMHRLLERVAGFSEKLDGLLRELKQLEIIYEQGLLAEPGYVFKHAVIQDVAYNSLLLQRRKELHQAVGLAIAELYPDRLTDHYGELAHHFALAENWTQAFEYSVLAGDRAAHAFANTEAKDHYARALRVAEKLTISPAMLTSLHVKRGAVLSVIAEYEEAAAHYQHALDLVRQIGDRRAEVEILIGLADVYYVYHRPDQALASNQEAGAIARELGDAALQGVCVANRVEIIVSWYGHVPEVRAGIDEALRLVKHIEKPHQLARTLIIIGGVFQWRADFDRAFTHLRRGIDCAVQAHAGFQYGFGIFHMGHGHMARGEYEEALRRYRQMTEYAEAAGDKFYLARAPNLIGGVHLELYDLDAAIELNREGEEVAHRLFPWPEPRCHSFLKLGLAHLGRGECDRAADALMGAWELLGVDTWAQWRWHIPLLRARAELALMTRRHDDAWQFATQSFDLATKSDARKHIAAAQRVQGEILAATGRFEPAADLLAGSVKLAERIHAVREEWLARAALARLLLRTGRDTAAEEQFTRAAETIEAIADKLRPGRLRARFLAAEPVAEIYRTLGRRPPERAE
jgi:class 3 adenylate cyclase/tetratricopeptide (TPR) repeat protein